MPGTWIDKWEVRGSKGDLYTVAKKLDGNFGCSCPGWKFKKAPKPDCKHIKAIITAMNAGIVPASKLKSNVTENREQIVRERLERLITPGSGFEKAEQESRVEVDNDFFSVKRKFKLEE